MGVDGGATKTVAVIGRLDGTILGSARALPSNYHNVGVMNASEAIRSSILAASRKAGVSASASGTIVMGLAGMDSPSDFRVGRKIADLTRLGKDRIIKHDSIIALYASTLGAPGIVANAGTGSFAAGLDAHGRAIRAGGWGNIIDDEGSAYDVGKLGIRAALRAFDGTERKTAITSLLVRELRLRTLEDIAHEVYEKPMRVEGISATSKLIAKAAIKGDHVAREIFAHEGRVLARLVWTVARRLDMTKSKPNIYLAGGVFRAGSIILSPFKRELKKYIMDFAICRPVFEPVVGAFILALKKHHIEARGRVLANLRTTYQQHLNGIG